MTAGGRLERLCRFPHPDQSPLSIVLPVSARCLDRLRPAISAPVGEGDDRPGAPLDDRRDGIQDLPIDASVPKVLGDGPGLLGEGFGQLSHAAPEPPLRLRFSPSFAHDHGQIGGFLRMSTCMLTIMSSRVTDRRDLGRLVRERRRAWSLTQADLAAAAGVGRGVLQKLETGRGDVTVSGVLAILSALSLDVDLVERETDASGL